MARSGLESWISALGNEHGELPRDCDGRRCSAVFSAVSFAL